MNTSTSSSTLPSAAENTDKTVAIVSYLTLVGFIVALVLHGSRKNALGAFHLRQSLGLMVTSIAIVFVSMVLGFVPFLGWMVSFALYIGLFALWLIGLIGAVNGQMKPVPILGEHFQNWFARTFE